VRVLHVVHDFLPLVRAGVEVYTYQLARAQARRHEVAVFHASFIPGTPNYTVRQGSWHGVYTIEAVNNRLYDSFLETWRNPAMEAIFHDTVRDFKPDAVHFQHLMHHSAGCVRIAKEAGARTVFTLHDFYAVCPAGGQLVIRGDKICPGPGAARCPGCYAASALHLGPAERALTGGTFTRMVPLARRFRQRAPALVDRTVGLTRRLAAMVNPPATWTQIKARSAALLCAVDACDAVLSPSRFLGRSLQAYGMKHAFVHSDYGFIPPSADKKTAPAPDNTRRPLRVGFIGPVTRHKGLELLLRAAAIAGDGVEVHVHGSEVVDRALAARLRAAHPAAVFHGPYDPAGLDEVFAGLDLLAVPSRWPENSPLVIHEAFLRRVPVVASHIGGIPELLRDAGPWCLFPPGDVEALAHTLRRLRGDPSALARARTMLPPVKTIDENAREVERYYKK